MILATYLIGPLRVSIDTATGRVVSVEDRITGAIPAMHYSPEYIACAERQAQIAWAATAEA